MWDLIAPQPEAGVCPLCFNFTLEADASRCRACRSCPGFITAMAAVSYAPGGSGLHHALADYKRTAEPATSDLGRALGALLDDFVGRHEGCLARSGGVSGFTTVAVVPSGDAQRDRAHPLRRLVRDHVPALGPRYRDVLRHSGRPRSAHRFEAGRFALCSPVQDEHILLVDDVWTTGASAQGAAAVLIAGGAASVSAVVIGRYVNRDWHDTGRRLDRLQLAGAAGRCAHCTTARDRSHLAGVDTPRRLQRDSLTTQVPAASYTAVSPKGGRSSVG